MGVAYCNEWGICGIAVYNIGSDEAAVVSGEWGWPKKLCIR